MLDTLIRGAKIVDGTGKAAFTADVGILDGMIEAVGNLSGAQAFETIEAAGRVLTPGFIDMHRHADAALFREGFGFSLFGARHLVTLALYIGFAALSCKLYKAADEKKRAQLRGLFAVLLLADEAFKQIGLQIGGNFNWDYLPLHLCSINIFLIALYAWKPSRLLDNFLYFICIPAATAALLFPTWTSLPAANFMFWHSTSVHILLAVYPIMLFSGGDIRPSVRYMGKCFLLLLAMAVPIYCVNLLLDTNFMFLMYAPDGNPLAWFRDHVGYHWIGFPVLLVAVFALMDVPIMLKKRKEDKLLSAVK